MAGWSSGGYGNYVIIYHGKMSDGNQYSTLYGHMRSVATSAGKYVQQGEIIGYVGSTGNSTGNHLHLEVWKGGSKANAVNPRGYIPMKSSALYQRRPSGLMKEEKRKRILRVGCLILAGIFALSMLGSVVMMLLV